MIGKVLANRYRVGERIGGGGMALVYRAVDFQLGREVAIKVLRGQFRADEDFIRRFRREAHNAASLSHPNIVQIYDVGEEDDQYFIVMELVQGKTLKDIIREQGPLPVTQACGIATEILDAMAHAHVHKIVHRDIKPHNILIAKDGRVKVTDFGIARATNTDTVTHTGTIVGSAHYFAPEQANGQPADEKSDIYSLGVVLYEMVTGVVPFQGDSPITVALKHLQERVVPPSQLNDEVPLELEAIILQALEKEPENRFTSAREMREAVEQFLQDHAAGKTTMPSGDFPTMDMSLVPSRKARLRGEPEEGKSAVKPEAEKKRRQRIGLIAGGVVLVLAALVWAIVAFFNVPELEVPDIVGMPLSEAKTELKNAKLSWDVRGTRYDDTVPSESVISTDPEPGTRVKQGKVIKLIISLGPESKQVPNVLGKSREEAEAILETEGFLIEVTEEVSEKPEGQVIDMMPDPLTMLKGGSKVSLVVSKGALTVPSVMGLSLDEAKKAIEHAGLEVGQVSSIPSTSAKDTVVDCSPLPGTVVSSSNQKVDLVVSKGAEGKAFEKEVTVPGDRGSSYSVTIVLVDVVDGVPRETQLDAGERKAGDKFKVKGTYYGEAHLKVMVDGSEQGQIKLP